MEPKLVSGGTDQRPLKALPEGVQRVTPYLVIKGAAKGESFDGVISRILADKETERYPRWSVGNDDE